MKYFNQFSTHSMPHFVVSFPFSSFSSLHPSWWNSNEQQVPQSLSKNISLKLESPPQQYHNATHLGLKLPDHELSSTQSVSQSHHDVGAVGGTKSQDQCISSESGQDESCGKLEGQRKPVFLSSNPDLAFNPSQVNYNYSMAVSYPYGDTYFGGLLTAYGPQTIVHPQMGPQMVGTAPGQVPLPYGHGYIFVNAKQYPGILRRRQARAKLDARNKPVKTRKRYLHESRHLHALNRVRGSGGRFLSTKKLQKPNPTLTMSTHCASHSDHLHQKKNISEIGDYFGTVTTCSDITSVSSSEAIFQQSDPRFAGIFALTGGAMQSGEGLMGCGTQNCASVVR